MNNMPTFEDITSFIKDNFKFIIKVMVVSILFYGIGIMYTLYSEDKISETVNDEQTNQITDTESNKELPSEEQIEALKEDAVSFDFYLETNESSAFSSVNLLNEVFTSPPIVQYVEEKANVSIGTNPEYAINITFNKNNSISTFIIGTGSGEDNIAIANSFYSLLENKEIPFLNNKNTYMISKPSLMSAQEKNNLDADQNEDNALENDTVVNDEESSPFSVRDLLIGSFLVIVASFFLGVILSLIKNMTKKEITETFTFSYEDTDNFINLTRLKKLPDEEKSKAFIHLIAHPVKPIKLLLGEEDIDENVKMKLSENFTIIEGKEIVEPLSNSNSLIISKDIYNINPDYDIDEVIILVKKGKTKKHWYQNQRVLLKNYKANVKIYLI